MSVVTLGRRPTLGEVIDYYARDDFVRFLVDVCHRRRVVMVISPQQHWEPNWAEDEVRAGDAAQVRRYVREKIVSALPDLGSADRPPFYPSFHQSVCQWKVEDVNDDGQAEGRRTSVRDCVFESDVATWRDAFQDVYAIVDRMDRHGVHYQLKFSGHRSLHVVLPAEVLPQDYRGKGTVHLASRLLSWSGSRAHHLPKITRMPYSLNEDTGLVCLPIERGALPGFRPWQANLHLVEMRGDAWFQTVDDPPREQARVTALLEETRPREWQRGAGEVDESDDLTPQVFYVTDRARIRSRYGTRLQGLSASGSVGQSWRLLSSGAPVSERTLQAVLADPDPDARWLGVEAYLLHGTTLSRRTFRELLEQEEEYVRPAATDVLLRFEDDVFDDLVGAIGNLDSHPTIGAKASQLLTLNAPLRSRVIEAILERTDRSSDALMAAACLSGALVGDWSTAMEIVRPVRKSDGLSQGEETRLAALDWMSQLGGWNKREEAQQSQALADLGPAIVDLLLIAAGSPARRFRRSVISVLADLADERAIDLLIYSLGDEYSQVRRKAIPGLIGIGEPAVDPLIEAASSDQVLVRRYALLCLGHIGAARARPTLLQGLDDSDVRVREQAVKGLNGLATEEDIGRLQRVAREDHWELAQLAVAVLASLGDEGQTAIRHLALEENDPAAAHYLVQQGDPRGREILVALLAVGGKQREAAAEYLRELKDECCIPYFAEQLETITHWRGAFMAQELGRIGTPEAVAVLIEALSRDTSHVRRGAVRGLMEARDPASIKALIRCLADEDRKVRRLAADALVHIGEAAAQVLEKALQNGAIQGRSQQQAARAVVEKIGEDRGLGH
jgi:HEAT repeat protein